MRDQSGTTIIIAEGYETELGEKYWALYRKGNMRNTWTGIGHGSGVRHHFSVPTTAIVDGGPEEFLMIRFEVNGMEVESNDLDHALMRPLPCKGGFITHLQTKDIYADS